MVLTILMRRLLLSKGSNLQQKGKLVSLQMDMIQLSSLHPEQLIFALIEQLNMISMTLRKWQILTTPFLVTFILIKYLIQFITTSLLLESSKKKMKIAKRRTYLYQRDYLTILMYNQYTLQNMRGKKSYLMSLLSAGRSFILKRWLIWSQLIFSMIQSSILKSQQRFQIQILRTY